MSSPDVLEHLPGDARLWVFGTDRALSPNEERHLLGRVDAFLEGWKAHGRPLSAGWAWRHGRFLLVGVDESVAPPTGCSVDALVRTLKEAEGELGVRLVEKNPVWYRDPVTGAILRVSRAEFREKGQRREVDAETVVFDPALTRMSELREGRWERPAGAGWHRRLLPAEEGAAPSG